MLNSLVFSLVLAVANANNVSGAAVQPDPVVLPAKQQKKLYKEWKCEEESTRVEFLSAETIGGFEVTGWLVSGCDEEFIQVMNERRGSWSYGHNDRDLRRRAPFDLSCEPSDVVYTYIDSTTRGATGCGAQLTYVRIDRKWIANVSSQ